MSRIDKIYQKLMSAQCDASFSFDELCFLLARLGFLTRQSGSHVVAKKGAAFVNIQSAGGQAKAYQVRQVRETLKKFKIQP